MSINQEHPMTDQDESPINQEERVERLSVRILAMGLWPKALPLQHFSTGDDFGRTLKNRT